MDDKDFYATKEAMDAHERHCDERWAAQNESNKQASAERNDFAKEVRGRFDDGVKRMNAIEQRQTQMEGKVALIEQNTKDIKEDVRGIAKAVAQNSEHRIGMGAKWSFITGGVALIGGLLMIAFRLWTWPT